MKRILIGVLLLVLLSAASVVFASPPGMKLYKNTELYLSFLLPEEFVEQKIENDGVTMFVAKDKAGNDIRVGGAEARGVERFNKMMLEQTVNSMKTQYPLVSGLKEDKTIDCKIVPIASGEQGVQYVHSYIHENRRYISSTFIIILNQCSYSMTYTLFAEDYEKNKDKIAQSINSFTNVVD